MERVQDAPGVRQALLHAGVDPLGAVAGDCLDGGALLVGRLSEEQAGHLLAVSVVRPDDPFALVVDDHGDVRVPLPAAGPVHAYRGETVEHARHRGFQAGGDPARDMAGGPPRDAWESARGLLAGDRRRPCALHLETAGEPAVRLRPRHLGGHHAMLRARHARRQAHELDPIAAEVLVAPSPFAATPPI